MSDRSAYPYPEPSSRLLRLVLQKDRGGWDRLVALISPPVYGWLLRRGLQEADAQDVLGEVLLSVSRYIDSYEAGRPFTPWLLAIVRSRYIDAYRRGLQRPAGVGGTDFLNVVHGQVDRSTEEEEDDFRQDLLRQALSMVEREVEREEWEVFQRKVLLGEDYDTIVETMKIPRSRAYRIVFKVNERLRELLLDEGSLGR
jgi:RNA polymerase sigma-70 factor (ECF subfamily)